MLAVWLAAVLGLFIVHNSTLPLRTLITFFFVCRFKQFSTLRMSNKPTIDVKIVSDIIWFVSLLQTCTHTPKHTAPQAQLRHLIALHATRKLHCFNFSSLPPLSLARGVTWVKPVFAKQWLSLDQRQLMSE